MGLDYRAKNKKAKVTTYSVNISGADILAMIFKRAGLQAHFHSEELEEEGVGRIPYSATKKEAKEMGYKLKLLTIDDIRELRLKGIELGRIGKQMTELDFTIWINNFISFLDESNGYKAS